jgi:hypothetical protein
MRPAVLAGLLSLGCACSGEPTQPLLKLRTETVRRLDAPPPDAGPDAGRDRRSALTNQAHERNSPPTNQAPKPPVE